MDDWMDGLYCMAPKLNLDHDLSLDLDLDLPSEASFGKDPLDALPMDS